MGDTPLGALRHSPVRLCFRRAATTLGENFYHTRPRQSEAAIVFAGSAKTKNTANEIGGRGLEKATT